MELSRHGGLRERLPATYLKGVIGGLGGGLLTVVLPPVGVLLLGAGAVAASRAAIRNPSGRLRLLVVVAGFMTGLGILLLYGSWNLVSACRDTTDFCGNANVGPFVVVSMVIMAVGSLATVAAVRAAKR